MITHHIGIHSVFLRFVICLAHYSEEAHILIRFVGWLKCSSFVFVAYS